MMLFKACSIGVLNVAFLQHVNCEPVAVNHNHFHNQAPTRLGLIPADLITTSNQTGQKKKKKRLWRQESDCGGEHSTQTNTTGSTKRLCYISAELEKQLSLRFLLGGTMESSPRRLGKFWMNTATSPALSPWRSSFFNKWKFIVWKQTRSCGSVSTCYDRHGKQARGLHHFSLFLWQWLAALKKKNAVRTNRGNVCLCVSESVHSCVNFSMGNMSLWGKMGWVPLPPLGSMLLWESVIWVTFLQWNPFSRPGGAAYLPYQDLGKRGFRHVSAEPGNLKLTSFQAERAQEFHLEQKHRIILKIFPSSSLYIENHTCETLRGCVQVLRELDTQWHGSALIYHSQTSRWI